MNSRGSFGLHSWLHWLCFKETVHFQMSFFWTIKWPKSHNFLHLIEVASLLHASNVRWGGHVYTLKLVIQIMFPVWDIPSIFDWFTLVDSLSCSNYTTVIHWRRCELSLLIEPFTQTFPWRLCFPAKRDRIYYYLNVLKSMFPPHAHVEIISTARDRIGCSSLRRSLRNSH